MRLLECAHNRTVNAKLFGGELLLGDKCRGSGACRLHKCGQQLLWLAHGDEKVGAARAERRAQVGDRFAHELGTEHARLRAAEAVRRVLGKVARVKAVDGHNLLSAGQRSDLVEHRVVMHTQVGAEPYDEARTRRGERCGGRGERSSSGDRHGM